MCSSKIKAMAKELNEDTGFKISVKTLIGIIQKQVYILLIMVVLVLDLKSEVVEISKCTMIQAEILIILLLLPTVR